MRSHKSAKEVLWPCGVWFLSNTSCGCLDQVPLLEKEPGAVNNNRGELWKLDHDTRTKMCAPVNKLQILNPADLLLVFLSVLAHWEVAHKGSIRETDTVQMHTHTQIEEL